MNVRVHQLKSDWRAVARSGVLGFVVIYAALELAKIAEAVSLDRLLVAVALTAGMVPLHLRHLWFGMRSRRPPNGGATLLAIALAELAGLIVVGPSWVFMLVALAVSSLIVLPARWSPFAVFVCVFSVEGRGVLAGFHGVFGPYPVNLAEAFNVSYGILVMALGEFALVWLLAAVRELQLSEDALARAAAESERRRVQSQIRASVEHRLSGMLSAGEAARGVVDEQPGIAAPVVMLDRLIELSHGALSDVRRVVADARTPAGSTATAALVQAARDSVTPIGRAMTVGRARLACLVQFGLWLGFPPLFVSGAFGTDPGSLAVILPASAMMAALQLWLIRDVQRGERPSHGTLRWLLMAVLWPGLLPVAGPAWEVGGFVVAASAVLTFRGWLRVLPVLAVAAGIGAYDAFVQLPLAPNSPLVWALQIGGDVTLGLFVPAGLAASTRLVAVLAELDRVRGQLAEHAAHSERRRLSTDMHDVLGQSLTAISLKASLAREMIITGHRAAARSEIEEVLALASRQTAELESVARDEREVEFPTELEDAVALLRAAGVTVTVSNGAGPLDRYTSALLGWTLREGTTNILRHANAHSCEIVVNRSGTHVTLELRNDGACTRGSGGTGLLGLSERLAVAAGRTDARAFADGRFSLRVELPT